jgi:hypothetical protein
MPNDRGRDDGEVSWNIEKMLLVRDGIFLQIRHVLLPFLKDSDSSASRMDF